VGPAAGLFSEAFYRDCRRALGPHGIVVAQSESPLFHGELICAMHASLRAAGFLDAATLHFPQCTYPSGWWSATMACKDASLSPWREEAVAGKNFPTRYYNLGIHAAALAVPEFLHQALLNPRG
jgi:spermidine synthase